MTGRLAERIRRIFGTSSAALEERVLAGRSVVGTPGFLRQKTDYDDAWTFALTAHYRTIMDVGANRGFTALLALLSAGSESKRLLLVDANSAALGVACENLCLNGFSANVAFHCGLVSEMVGEEVDFFTVGTGDAGSIYRSHARTAVRQDQRRRMVTSTIDAIASARNFVPDLVKIDVEGAELKALKGAGTIGHSEAIFFVEMHALKDRPMVESAAAVMQWAAENGRTAYYMKHHVPLDSPDMIADRGRCHLLIIKSTQAYPEYLKAIRQGSPVS